MPLTAGAHAPSLLRVPRRKLHRGASTHSTQALRTRRGHCEDACLISAASGLAHMMSAHLSHLPPLTRPHPSRLPCGIHHAQAISELLLKTTYAQDEVGMRR